MISLIKNGSYRLIETRCSTKILYLDDDAYAWIEPMNIGDILVATHAIHKTDCVLATGVYRIYSVDDERYLTDQMHLELEVGKQEWQGYLLLSGLPSAHKKRGRIIPTYEVITDNPRITKQIAKREFAASR